MKIFLGGTYAETDWRGILKPLLTVDYFDPVVEDWNEACQAIEEEEKNKFCNVHLYVITSEMTGVFSIAEAIESAMLDGKEAVFYVLTKGFTKSQLGSLQAVAKMVRKYGGHTGRYYATTSLVDIADYLNNMEI